MKIVPDFFCQEESTEEMMLLYRIISVLNLFALAVVEKFEF